MYAVLSDRSRQTTVRQGDEILCDVSDDFRPGESITFDQVLLVGNEGNVQIGTPFVSGASVTGTMLREEKAKKVIAFRFHRRKNVRVKRGHRARYARIRIDSINA